MLDSRYGKTVRVGSLSKPRLCTACEVAFSEAKRTIRSCRNHCRYETQLWQMADALRGSMDGAEHKHVVLGLISS